MVRFGGIAISTESWDVGFSVSGISFKFDIYYMKGTRNKSIQIDMMFKYIFHPGLPEKCLHKSIEKSQNVAKATFGQCWVLIILL